MQREMVQNKSCTLLAWNSKVEEKELILLQLLGFCLFLPLRLEFEIIIIKK